jgi:hypothetical protein
LVRILTVINLRRWGFTLVNWCCLYKNNEETIDCLLILWNTLVIFGTWFLVYSDFIMLSMPSNSCLIVGNLKGGDISKRSCEKLFMFA